MAIWAIWAKRGSKRVSHFWTSITPRWHQMDFTGCHMETLFLALLGTLGGPAMGPHMATQAIWVHMLQIGVQKGVSLLDLHYPQVASNGFHRVSYGDPLFSPFGTCGQTRYGPHDGCADHMGPYAPNRGPKGCLTFGPPCPPGGIKWISPGVIWRPSF